MRVLDVCGVRSDEDEPQPKKRKYVKSGLFKKKPPVPTAERMRCSVLLCCCVALYVCSQFITYSVCVVAASDSAGLGGMSSASAPATSAEPFAYAPPPPGT
jgi:hypothetical protein